MLKRLFIVVCLLTLASKGQATSAKQDSVQLSVDQLRSDHLYYRSVIEKAHPGLYRYISKDSLDNIFNNTLRDINRPMKSIEFWQILQNIVVKIGCGHTSLKPIPTSFNNIKAKEYSFLPFYISVKDDRIFIQKYISSPKSSYRIGDEILTINGDSAIVILNKVRSLISGDGFSNSYKDHKIEKGDFNWLFGVIYKPVAKFDIKFRRRDSTFRIDVQSVPNAVSLQHKGLIVDSIKHISITFPEDIHSTAFLRIKDFLNDDYVKYHKKVFSMLEEKNTENLIIDLRNNPGGRSDVAIDLMKYLIPKSFYFTKHTGGEVGFNFSKPFEITKSPDLSILKAIPNAPYRKELSGNMIQQPYKKRFKGTIYLLINGGTYSSATFFAVGLKTQGNCIIIGSESGGGKFGCNGGKIVTAVLPQSNIPFSLPLMWTYSVATDSNKGQGLMPDILKKSQTLWVDDPVYWKSDPVFLHVKTLINLKDAPK